MDANVDVQGHHSSPFLIGPCTIEPNRNRIVCRGKSVHLEPRVMDLLLVLASHAGEVVSKEELIQQVWHGAFVSDHVLTHAVWQLRRVIQNPGLIESIPKRGYRLTLDPVPLSRPRPESHDSIAQSRRSAVAVLPLAHLGRDQEQEFFTEGMTDALIGRLAQFDDLRVISRTSSMRYKNRPKSIKKIAAELAVDAVIEGSVLRIGNRVRISAQLIDAHTDAHLWAGTYDHDLSDIFELQSNLADMIAQKVSSTLRPSSDPIPSSPVNPEAYEAYLRGRSCWMRFSAEDFDVALHYFQQAAQLDPSFAQPWSGISQVWFARENTGILRPFEAVPQARAAAQRALSIDGNSAEAHAAMGLVHFHFDWDVSAAEAEFQRAVKLNPNDSAARIFYSDLLFSTQQPAQGFEHIYYASRLDPLSPGPRCFLGWYLLFLKRIEPAIEQLRKAVDFEPAFGAAHQGLWGAFYLQQNWGAALDEARTFFSIRSQPLLIPFRPSPVSEQDYRESMLQAANQLVETNRSRYVRNIRIARLYAHAGDSNQACTWLQRAFSERESPLVHLGVSWDWQATRSDPRFSALLNKVGIHHPARS